MLLFIPKCAKARLVRPTRFTTARVIVRLDPAFQINSFSKSPMVPMAIKVKPLILMNSLISNLIIT